MIKTLLTTLTLLGMAVGSVLFGAERSSVYLDIMQKSVEAYSPERIRDYIDRVDRDGITEHGYARLTANLGILISQGRMVGNKGLFEEMMDIYDRQLADTGYEIIRYRKEFVEMLSEEAGEIMSKISGGREDLKIEYKTSCDFVTSPEGRDILYSQIYHHRDRDIYNGYASLGPHRDDIEFYINGKDAKKYGSQGQQRTIALSLKLAEIRIAKQLLDEPPVLLLDDVLSELDLDRQRFLVSEIDEVQLFITSAELNEEVVSALRGGTLFRIEEGTVTRVDKY